MRVNKITKCVGNKLLAWTVQRAAQKKLHLRQLVHGDTELLVLFLRCQSFIFLIKRMRAACNCAAEGDRTANLNELKQGHADDEGSHADPVSSKRLLEFGGQGLRQSGVHVQKLLGYIRGFFLVCV
jgi:hypothetical protein